MPLVRVLGLNLELPWDVEDAEPSSEPADVVLTLETGGGALPLEPSMSGAWPNVRRGADAVSIDFSGFCRIDVSTDGRKARCTPYPGSKPEEVRRIVLDHLVPRLLSRRHDVILHASAVELEGKLLGFVAASGSGKSTLALWLAMQGGGTLFSDDALVLNGGPGGAIASPLWRSVRIYTEELPEGVRGDHWRASGGKSALGEGAHPTLRFAHDPAPLHALYTLGEPDETISIRQLAPREALLSMLRQCFHLELDNLGGMSKLMERMETLGITRSAYELRYPRDKARLPQVQQALLEHLAEARTGRP